MFYKSTKNSVCIYDDTGELIKTYYFKLNIKFQASQEKRSSIKLCQEKIKHIELTHRVNVSTDDLFKLLSKFM